MKKTTLKYLFLAFTLFFAATFLSPAYAYADTDGSELQVVQPEQLEIQLGIAWAGVEFQLRTDSGLYPNTISVGDDGVLRLEIGGSSSYILSCVGFTNTLPSTEPEGYGEAAVIEIVDSTPEPTSPVTGTVSDDTAKSVENPPEESAAPDLPAEAPVRTIAGIPVKHLVLFGAGFFICCTALVVMRISAVRRESADDADFEEYDE